MRSILCKILQHANDECLLLILDVMARVWRPFRRCCCPIGGSKTYATALLSQLFKIIIRFSLICGWSQAGVVLLVWSAAIGCGGPTSGGAYEVARRDYVTATRGGSQASVVYKQESIEDVLRAQVHFYHSCVITDTNHCFFCSIYFQ